MSTKLSPDLTPEQNEQYYRIRLDAWKLHHTKGSEYRAMCPLHSGSNHSQLWVDTAEGHWICFSCGEKGSSAYFFEQKLLALEWNRSPMHDEVMQSLRALLETSLTQRVYPDAVLERGEGQGAGASGNPNGKGWDRRHAQDWYRYTDEFGQELYTVWRFVDRKGSKITPADRPCPCRENPDAECTYGCGSDSAASHSKAGANPNAGRLWSTKGVLRVLYRLPDVIASAMVFVVEGEKNANDLSRALAGYLRTHKGFPLGSMMLDRVAVTTNPGGAMQWKREHGFGPYFKGKVVIKLGDNDNPGRVHDRDAWNDIAPYAKKLFTLALPFGDGPAAEGPASDGKDVSDFLAEHSIEDLLKLLPQRKEWTGASSPQEPSIADSLAPRELLVKPSQLVAPGADPQVDWLIEGLIERGTRGLVVAPPKTGKSLLFLELALCLATGQRFLAFPANPRKVKCAIISREDGPKLVHRRLMQLARSRGIDPAELDRNLVVNTEAQSARFKIDRDEDLTEMADWIKVVGAEFVVIDVLNKLHDGEENNSDTMTRVMQRFDDLRTLSGAQITVIHHTNKQGGVKGATSIEGWADWIARLEQSQEDEEVKTLFLRTKSSGAVVPRTIRYSQSADQTQSRIAMVESVRR